jgi:glyoxylase-like metal-dependent hydrolase (beta-lactamase superfamily II)
MTAPLRAGPYDVTVLADGIFETGKEVLVHADGEAARQRLLEAWPGEKVSFVVNAFLLRGPDGLTLIDAGTGKAWGEALGKLRPALADLGIRPEHIDRVLLTHLHGDHALGLFEDNRAWLPRAEILVPEADLDFYTDEAAMAAVPEARRMGFKIAASLLDLYGDRLRRIGAGPIPGLPGIEAIPLPGHTKGQSGYLLGEGSEALLIWADALHLSALQVRDPRAGLAFDYDGRQALATRIAMLERAASESWRVTGNHLAEIGRIRRDGEGYAFVAV